ncbi:MAG: 16S rRNA (guanine(966)-N(2))-methyltransferase, partial [uncultured Nocardioides sp.]
DADHRRDSRRASAGHTARLRDAAHERPGPRGAVLRGGGVERVAPRPAVPRPVRRLRRRRTGGMVARRRRRLVRGAGPSDRDADRPQRRVPRGEPGGRDRLLGVRGPAQVALRPLRHRLRRPALPAPRRGGDCRPGRPGRRRLARPRSTRGRRAVRAQPRARLARRAHGGPGEEVRRDDALVRSRSPDHQEL